MPTFVMTKPSSPASRSTSMAPGVAGLVMIREPEMKGGWSNSSTPSGRSISGSTSLPSSRSETWKVSFRLQCQHDFYHDRITRSNSRLVPELSGEGDAVAARGVGDGPNSVLLEHLKEFRGRRSGIGGLLLVANLGSKSSRDVSIDFESA